MNRTSRKPFSGSWSFTQRRWPVDACLYGMSCQLSEHYKWLADRHCLAGVMDSSVIQRCLQLFTHFPFNNLLHHRVAGLVLTALERGSDEFLRYLFGACQLIQWLTQAPDLVVPASRSLDSRAGKLRHVSETPLA